MQNEKTGENNSLQVSLEKDSCLEIIATDAGPPENPERNPQAHRGGSGHARGCRTIRVGAGFLSLRAPHPVHPSLPVKRIRAAVLMYRRTLGRAAIKEWKTNASTKYQYTIKLFACEQKNGKTVVTGRLTGDFPGNPVNLRFFFGLEGDKIASLEIIP